MKISPVAPAATVAAPAPARTMRMTTNVTPGRIDAPEAAPADPAAAPPRTIADPSEPATAATEATEPLSPQFAALAKQRRALQVKERELQARETALASKPAEAGAIDVARLKAEPLSVLLEAGVTYQQLTDAILANQGDPDMAAIKAELKALKEGVDTQFKDRDSQTEQQVLATMKREATALAAEGEAFEMVRETKSIPTVMELIERTYRDTGEVLDVKEALQLVEDDLLDENLKIARLQKVQGRLAPTAPAAPPQQPRQMRTLTNRDTATAPMSPKQRALAAFQGTLKR